MANLILRRVRVYCKSVLNANNTPLCQETIVRIDRYTECMTLLKVGNRHYQTSSTSTREEQIFGVRHNYVIKWVVAKPLATIIGHHILKFVCENIVCRFGKPRRII